MLEAMRPGSVIVDLAIEAGGNVEGAVSGRTVVKHGVKIIGEPNLPAQVAADASLMFSRNAAAFLELIVKDGKLDPKWDDEVVKAIAVTHGGEIRHQPTADAIAAKEAS
jgi:NAD(P) transhydrogenase subunit alpha